MSRTSFLGVFSMENQTQTAIRGEVASHRPLVLVVDDHEVGRKSLARLLDASGFEVIAADDGESALKMMRHAERIDFVLTDLRLPDVDGRDVVFAARQLDPLPRIALITGWDLEPDEIEKLKLDWVFLKPLNVREIIKKLQEEPPIDDPQGID